ncbi:unnamed protein product [Pseudo-nitzschia multistriata]|uniref:ZC3H15/TMA46 family C-terminal domain-containing protein n=1 Tax=Pseudo-nitzschia multistriata TaxID=183589 RepID=A0A448Z365_9STRA|nr:unnamed protein product [Pseudo-nitzschia multistriata]
MAKKGNKGAATSKKAEQKKKNQQIEDRTFGLKNKNKSKKVQQYVKSVTNSVNNTGDRKKRQEEERRKKMKEEQKARKKAMKAEAEALFNDALGALSKKKTSMKAGKTEAKGRDADDEGKKKGTSRAMKMMYQMDGMYCFVSHCLIFQFAFERYKMIELYLMITVLLFAAKEMDDKLKEDPNYVPTLEDEIEAERQKKVAELKKNGKKGTPITAESFAIWAQNKRKRRAAEAKKMVEQEMRKKKGGKGLAVLSGRALYDYKRDLFNIESENASNETSDQDNSKENPVDQVATQVQSDLFLDGDDDSLDDLDDE